MTVSMIPDSVLSEETHRLIRGILQREGIRPELRPQTETILLHWLRSAVRESEEMRKAELMEQGFRQTARYKFLLHHEPTNNAELDECERILDDLKAQIHALPSGPGYRPSGGAA